MPIPDQPNTPLKPEVIVGRRPGPPNTGASHAFPSAGGSGMTSLGPRPKKVLTIVSWNVQKFESTKSLANPYVNVVINRVLAALDADVCMLLEARENNSENLSAIEHQLANPSDYKDQTASEALWDLNDLEGEATDALAQMETVAAQVQNFQAISTDLTGKRYKPPRRIYLFGNPAKSYVFPTMAKGLSIDPASPANNPVYTGAWRDYYQQSDTMRLYYTAYQISTDQPIGDLSTVPPLAEAELDVMFRLNRCDTCGERLGDSLDCGACADYGPYSDVLDNLRHEVDECAFSLGGVDLESYAILVRDGGYAASDLTIQMRDKDAQAARYGCRLLRHMPPSGAAYSAPERRAAYAFSKKLRPDGDPQRLFDTLEADLKLRGLTVDGDTALLDALGFPGNVSPEARLAQWQLQFPGITPEQAATAQGLNQYDIIFDAGLDLRGFETAPRHGPLLPYLDPSATTYGRSPFVLPVTAALSGLQGAVTFPIVAFHAPYGKDDEAGLAVRVEAVHQALQADVGDGVMFGDHDNAILMGDLNLDPSASTTTMKGRAASTAYQGLAAAGFAPAIPAVPSSLATIYNNAKKQKTDGPYKKYEGAGYQSVQGDVSNFTSSAYDNILVRGADLQSRVVTAAVVDVVGWILDNAGDIDQSHAVAEWPGFTALTPQQQAFFIYRKYVSDHLPVLIDIEVEPLRPGFDQDQQALLAYRQDIARREMITFAYLSYDACLYMDVCPSAAMAEVPVAGALFGVGPLLDVSATHFKLQTLRGEAVLPNPERSFGEFTQGAMAAVLYVGGAPSSVPLMIEVATPRDLMIQVSHDGTWMFIMGKVLKVSQDKLRVRIQVDNRRCTLPVTEGCSAPPQPGMYVMALVTGLAFKEGQMAD